MKTLVATLLGLVVAGAAQAQPRVGADRDAHGCIGSAGYRWCAREAQCVRPWELAKARGFVNSSRGFTRWCGVS